MDIVALLSRWTHIAAMAFLVGGSLYAWLIAAPAAESLSAPERSKFNEKLAAQWSGLAIVVLVLLVASGLYNLLRKTGLPPGYHMWFGIKMLFAAHILAVAVLLGRASADLEKRKRWAGGVAVSGLIAMLISAYLRAIQQ